MKKIVLTLFILLEVLAFDGILAGDAKSNTETIKIEDKNSSKIIVWDSGESESCGCALKLN